jgi:mRNA interferase RelE/StbE
LAWTVSITPEAQRQLQRLDRPVTERIGKFIDQRLVGIEKPQSIGHALTGDHRGRWTYRVGDYRLICEFRNEELVVVVVKIGHRRSVYD